MSIDTLKPTATMNPIGELAPPLVDRYGRVHTNLRISVTDRCNIRCFYCMPNENVRFNRAAKFSRFEEIERFARVAARLGVNKLRLTGGEPLVRQDIDRLVARLVSIPGIDDVGAYHQRHPAGRPGAGASQRRAHRLNISLDTLKERDVSKILAAEASTACWKGIFAAQRAGFRRIRLNAVAIRDLTEEEIVPLGDFARRHGFEMRFIEFMPLDGDNAWNNPGAFRRGNSPPSRRGLRSARGRCRREDPQSAGHGFRFRRRRAAGSASSIPSRSRFAAIATACD